MSRFISRIFEMELNSALFKKFNIRPISIVLDKLKFTETKMKCTATSSDSNEKLTCYIEQEETNTFTIKVKRTGNFN